MSHGCTDRLWRYGGAAKFGKTAASTVDDFAKRLQGVDDIARLREELQAVNGGRTEVPPAVAEQIEARQQVVGEIIVAVDTSKDLACSA